MADNISIKDGNGSSKTLATKEVSAGVHAPKHAIVDSSTGLDFGSGNPMPVKQAGLVFASSTLNNSTSNLVAGESFVGAWEDIFNQQALQIMSDGTQPLRYTIEQAIDAGGTDIVSTMIFYRGANEDLCENLQLNGNYVRVSVKNIGASTTSSFELNCTYGPLPSLPQALTNAGNMRVAARETQNFTRKLRDNFQSWPNSNWSRVSKASGDLLQLDGNVSGCGYLVMSLDPLVAGTETFIESDPVYNLPVEVAVGLHTSQRTYGQEMSVSVISSDSSAAPAEIQILNIQQAASVLTINTSAAHSLRIGQRFGIYGVSNDSRLNYAALVVASTPIPTQFTATAGPQGTIASLTVGPFSPASAFVYLRDAIHWASNGTSMIMENSAATNAAFYVKAEGGDATPIGGTFNGAHGVTTLTTASSQIVNAPLNYAFRPTDQFMLSLLSDRLQWTDAPVNTLTQSNPRATFSEVVPHPDAQYVVRIAIKNRKGLTIPVCKIVSAVKTGTTTATVTTDVAHGLTIGDYVNAFGDRDQTNFPALSVATVVASVINATSFTIVWGSAVTATTYGGYVSKVQGQQVQQGAIAQSVQSAAIAGSLLTLVGSASWTGPIYGDYVNLHGCRDASTGADLGLDGTYRVRDLATTNLVLEPIGSTSIPSTLTLTNCGGAILKRTDLRLSFARLFDYERLRVETIPRPASDLAGGFPMTIQGTPAVTISGTPAVTMTTTAVTQSTAAAIGVDGIGAWGVRGIPSRTIDAASAAITTTTTSAAISLLNNTGSVQANFDVTVVSGTLPRMIGRVQGSFDNGVTFVNVYDVGVMTTSTAKNNDTPCMPAEFTHMRYSRIVTGTTPSFTNSVNRVNRPGEDVKRNRRMIDLVMALTATTASTEWLYSNGCVKGQVTCTPLTGASTAPALKVQACHGDPAIAANWFDVVNATLTTSATLTTASAIFDLPHARFLRLVPTLAGVATPASTGYELCLTAWE